jgi:hypothetical protein
VRPEDKQIIDKLKEADLYVDLSKTIHNVGLSINIIDTNYIENQMQTIAQNYDKYPADEVARLININIIEPIKNKLLSFDVKSEILDVSEYEKTISDLRAQLSDKNNRVAHLNANIHILENAVQGYQGNIREFNNEFKTLMNNVNNLMTNIRNYSTNCRNFNSRIVQEDKEFSDRINNIRTFGLGTEWKIDRYFTNDYMQIARTVNIAAADNHTANYEQIASINTAGFFPQFINDVRNYHLLQAADYTAIENAFNDLNFLVNPISSNIQFINGIPSNAEITNFLANIRNNNAEIINLNQQIVNAINTQIATVDPITGQLLPNNGFSINHNNIACRVSYSIHAFLTNKYNNNKLYTRNNLLLTAANVNLTNQLNNMQAAMLVEQNTNTQLRQQIAALTLAGATSQAEVVRLTAVVQRRDQRIHGLVTTRTNLQAQITRLNADLQLARADYDALELVNANNINDYEDQIARLNANNTDINNQLNTMRLMFMLQAGLNAQLNNQIRDLNNTSNAHVRIIAMMNGIIRNRDATIQQRDATIQQRDADIARLNGEIKTQTDARADLETKLAARLRDIQMLTADLLAMTNDRNVERNRANRNRDTVIETTRYYERVIANMQIEIADEKKRVEDITRQLQNQLQTQQNQHDQKLHDQQTAHETEIKRMQVEEKRYQLIIANLTRNLELKEQENKDLQRTIDDMKRSLTDEEKKLRDTNVELKRKEDESKRKDEELAQLREELAQLTAELALLRGRIADLERQLQDLRDQLEEKNKENKNLTDENEELKLQLQQLQDNLNTMQQQYADTKDFINKAENIITQNIEDIEKNEEQIKKLTARNNDYKRQNINLNNENKRLNDEIKRLNDQISIKDNSLRRHDATGREIKEELTRQNGEINTLRAQIVQNEKQIQELKDANATADNNIRVLTNDNENMRQEIVLLKEAILRLEKENKILKRENESLKKFNREDEEKRRSNEEELIRLSEIERKLSQEYRVLLVQILNSVQNTGDSLHHTDAKLNSQYKDNELKSATSNAQNIIGQMTAEIKRLQNENQQQSLHIIQITNENKDINSLRAKINELQQAMRELETKYSAVNVEYAEYKRNAEEKEEKYKQEAEGNAHRITSLTDSEEKLKISNALLLAQIEELKREKKSVTDIKRETDEKIAAQVNEANQNTIQYYLGMMKRDYEEFYLTSRYIINRIRYGLCFNIKDICFMLMAKLEYDIAFEKTDIGLNLLSLFGQKSPKEIFEDYRNRLNSVLHGNLNETYDQLIKFINDNFGERSSGYNATSMIGLLQKIAQIDNDTRIIQEAFDTGHPPNGKTFSNIFSDILHVIGHFKAYILSDRGIIRGEDKNSALPYLKSAFADFAVVIQNEMFLTRLQFLSNNINAIRDKLLNEYEHKITIDIENQMLSFRYKNIENKNNITEIYYEFPYETMLMYHTKDIDGSEKPQRNILSMLFDDGYSSSDTYVQKYKLLSSYKNIYNANTNIVMLEEFKFSESSTYSFRKHNFNMQSTSQNVNINKDMVLGYRVWKQFLPEISRRDNEDYNRNKKEKNKIPKMPKNLTSFPLLQVQHYSSASTTGTNNYSSASTTGTNNYAGVRNQVVEVLNNFLKEDFLQDNKQNDDFNDFIELTIGLINDKLLQSFNEEKDDDNDEKNIQTISQMKNYKITRVAAPSSSTTPSSNMNTTDIRELREFRSYLAEYTTRTGRNYEGPKSLRSILAKIDADDNKQDESVSRINEARIRAEDKVIELEKLVKRTQEEMQSNTITLSTKYENIKGEMQNEKSKTANLQKQLKKMEENFREYESKVDVENNDLELELSRLKKENKNQQNRHDREKAQLIKNNDEEKAQLIENNKKMSTALQDLFNLLPDNFVKGAIHTEDYKTVTAYRNQELTNDMINQMYALYGMMTRSISQNNEIVRSIINQLDEMVPNKNEEKKADENEEKKADENNKVQGGDNDSRMSSQESTKNIVSFCGIFINMNAVLIVICIILLIGFMYLLYKIIYQPQVMCDVTVTTYKKYPQQNLLQKNYW